jgi:hypothetical protein
VARLPEGHSRDRPHSAERSQSPSCQGIPRKSPSFLSAEA